MAGGGCRGCGRWMFNCAQCRRRPRNFQAGGSGTPLPLDHTRKTRLGGAGQGLAVSCQAPAIRGVEDATGTWPSRHQPTIGDKPAEASGHRDPVLASPALPTTTISSQLTCENVTEASPTSIITICPF